MKTVLRILVVASCYITLQIVSNGVVLAQPLPLVGAKAEEPQYQAQLDIGRRIYREGVGASGEPLKAVAAAQVVLSGKDAACATCHRRSGYGTAEGSYSIRPITGPALFEEQTQVVRSPRIKAQLGTRQRPPYTDALLARALRGGMDSAGKPLDAVMPRYTLSDDELKAVATYLSTLSAKSSPGVDEEEIHFATVIQPGVNPAKRRAMLDIMQAFFRDKGANVRSDELRREAGTMRMYRAYRKWVLHVWELNGPSETWGSQLENLYSQQPVFALIGGLGESSWAPIHDFSERFEIPGVFAQVDLPVISGPNQFNFYFSRGVTLDAEVLAKFLRDKGEATRFVQVYRRDEAGLAAASAFRKAMPPDAAIDDLVLDGPADEAFWRRVAAEKAGALMLWLDAKDTEHLNTLGSGHSRPIYLSFDVLGDQLPLAALTAGMDIRMVYPSDLAPKHESRLLRTKVWLHSKSIPIINEPIQINTLFAMTVVNDALGHMMDSFSRDYFVERIEHVVSQTPTPSLFQSVSLGPGQRFAAKGRSIVQLEDGDKLKMKSLSAWLVP